MRKIFLRPYCVWNILCELIYADILYEEKKKKKTKFSLIVWYNITSQKVVNTCEAI